MKVYFVTMVNGFVLILLGLIGYLGSQTPSLTALIPVVAGIFLLYFVKGVKAENGLIAHLAVTLTLVLLIAFVKPLSGAIGRSDTGAIVRVSIMIVSSAVNMIYFILSFIAVRKARAKKVE